MDTLDVWVQIIGAMCFGLVVGWIAHSAFWQIETVGLKWLTAFVGVIGGSAFTGLFSKTLFGAYSIGLALTFFIRMLLFSPAADLMGRVYREELSKRNKDDGTAQ